MSEPARAKDREGKLFIFSNADLRRDLRLEPLSKHDGPVANGAMRPPNGAGDLRPRPLGPLDVVHDD